MATYITTRYFPACIPTCLHARFSPVRAWGGKVSLYIDNHLAGSGTLHAEVLLDESHVGAYGVERGHLEAPTWQAHRSSIGVHVSGVRLYNLHTLVCGMLRNIQRHVRMRRAWEGFLKPNMMFHLRPPNLRIHGVRNAGRITRHFNTRVVADIVVSLFMFV